jgi:DNA-binding XRE family transcriptional regulator
MAHHNRIRFHRKHWALSQADLARLLGFRSRSVISGHEFGGVLPNVRAMLAYQLIFGVTLDDLFPDITKEVHDHVMRQAAELDRRVRSRTDDAGRRIQQFLDGLLTRAVQTLDA